MKFRQLLTLISAGFSISSYAISLSAPVYGNDINVPQFAGGLEIDATALYLQPSFNDGALSYAITMDGNNNNALISSVEPSYHAGGEIGIGYIFQNTGNDIMLRYTHLNTQDQNSIINFSNNVFINSTIINLQETPLFSNVATGKQQLIFNQADLTVGQYMNIGQHWNMQLRTGLRYIDLENDLTGTYDQFIGEPPTRYVAKSNTEFDGLGPLLAVNSRYNIGKGFGVVGNLDGAALVGDKSAQLSGSLTLINSFTNFTSTLGMNQLNNDVFHLVPNIDLRLGLDYETKIFTVEAGYQSDHYFNVIDSIKGTTTATGASFLGPIIATQHRSADLSFNGPYFSVTYRA